MKLISEKTRKKSLFSFFLHFFSFFFIFFSLFFHFFFHFFVTFFLVIFWQKSEISLVKMIKSKKSRCFSKKNDQKKSKKWSCFLKKWKKSKSHFFFSKNTFKSHFLTISLKKHLDFFHFLVIKKVKEMKLIS